MDASPYIEWFRTEVYSGIFFGAEFLTEVPSGALGDMAQNFGLKYILDTVLGQNLGLSVWQEMCFNDEPNVLYIFYILCGICQNHQISSVCVQTSAPKAAP